MGGDVAVDRRDLRMTELQIYHGRCQPFLNVMICVIVKYILHYFETMSSILRRQSTIVIKTPKMKVIAFLKSC